MKLYDTYFRYPSTCLVTGPSGSGKTNLIAKILQNKESIFENGKCKNIIFFYKEWQQIYDVLENQQLVNRWINHSPTVNEIKEFSEPFRNDEGTICIIDDFMDNLNKNIADVFTKISHHYNVTVFLLLQNIFPEDRNFRTLSYNTKYMIIHKNPRISSQLNHLARQILPRNSEYIIQAYQYVTEPPYSYILLDLHQECPSEIRLRSHITPDTFPMRAYSQNK